MSLISATCGLSILLPCDGVVSAVGWGERASLPRLSWMLCAATDRVLPPPLRLPALRGTYLHRDSPAFHLKIIVGKVGKRFATIVFVVLALRSKHKVFLCIDVNIYKRFFILQKKWR